MKRGMVLATVLMAAATAVMAQDVINGDFLKRLGFNENEIERILEIETATAKERQQAQVELDLYQAQLEKLLLDPDVDLAKVEKLLRESAEWKVRGELADIRRRVQLRKIAGEERWIKLVRTIKVARDRLEERAGERAEARDKPAPAKKGK